ncbi:MAG TPA: ATP-binding protein, partial [Pyrinomonadaceae bacterium]|nr:ATP-binding protein [Pyrinomonadaceae bacterium]
MNVKNDASGGTEAQRGFLFQTYSLLLYLLLRRIEVPDLNITELSFIVEPEEGEDAKFLSTTLEDRKVKRVFELVQCKKVESVKSPITHAGMSPVDSWAAGTITYDKLKEWVTKKRPTQSLLDLLSSNDQLYYTAIVFGSPAKRVQNFIPNAAASGRYLHWYSPMYFRTFPIDYRHSKDPAGAQLQKGAFGTPEIRSRVRVLPVDSPSEMEAQCVLLLIHHFEVPEGKAPEVVRNLRFEIENRATARNQDGRSFSSGEIEALIAAGRNHPGRWQDAQKLLRPTNATQPRKHLGEAIGWSDFKEADLVNRPELTEAWQALKEKGFIVISGPAGTGKTTLCRFLASKYLAERSDRRVYYLATHPTDSLADETEFFVSHIQTETLFIIDDQHLAIEQVEKMVQKFLEFRIELKASAQLVVTSARTYTLAQATVRTQNRSELNQARAIYLRRMSKEEMIEILAGLRAKGILDTALSDRELAALSQNNLGLAIIIAQCSGRSSGPRTSISRLFESESLGRILTDWILERLARPKQYKMYAEEVAPVFIIGSYALPLTSDFTDSVIPLFEAGFLEADTPETDAATTFRPVNSRLAYIIRHGFYEDQLEVLYDYAVRYPNRLPLICERLVADGDQGSLLLTDLASKHFSHFLKTINDRLSPISLEGISKILNALFKARRGLGRKLLYAIAEPYGQSNRMFFSDFIRLDRVKKASELSSFFNALDRIDRYPVRRLPYEELGYAQIDIILQLFEYDKLDDIAACLHSLNRCSRSYAKTVYTRWKESSTFQEQVAQTEDEPNKLSIWVRFCRQLLPIDRKESKDFLKQHLSETHIVNAILKNDDLGAWSPLLLRLRKLQPSFTAKIGSVLLHDYSQQLVETVKNEDNLQAVTNNLYTLSRIHRRESIRFAMRILDHLAGLLAEEHSYRIIGSTLESLRKNVSMRIAQMAARSLDRDAILAGLRHEDDYYSLDLIGKFLYTTHAVLPALAEWLEERLDYSIYIRRIRALRSRELVYLFRGLMTAAAKERKTGLLHRFKTDAVWLEELRRGWDRSKNLNDKALCILLLLDVPISKADVLHLLSFRNLAEFENDILADFSTEKDPLNLANGLLASAKMDYEIGRKALRTYLTQITEKVRTDRAAQKRLNKSTSHRDPLVPPVYSTETIAHLGTMLQVAAAIEPGDALQLGYLIDLDRFVDNVTSEPNLGRVTAFIQGLHRVSRKLTRDFVSRTCSKETWSKQWDENEELENVVHYSRALRRVSRGTGREYVRFLLANYKEEIHSILETEANLMLVSNWVRVFSASGADFDDQLKEQMTNLVFSTIELDSRFRHLLAATEALIESAQKKMAIQLAKLTLQEVRQSQTISSIRDWIMIYQQAIYIERETGLKNFTKEIFSGIEKWYFFEVLGFESQSILTAYTCYLLKHSDNHGLDKLAEAVSERHSEILDKARNERSSVHRLLALILAEAPINEVYEAAEKNLSQQPWACGLASLLFALVY